MAASKHERWITKDGLLLLTAWARDGLTDKDIANNMGITTSTLYEYKNKFSAISEALKKGKEVVDFEIENALMKRAMGYKYTETTREPVRNPETGELKLVVTKEVVKEVAPDVTAQIFWLKNRKVKEWRDKQDLDVSIKEIPDIVIKRHGE